MKGPAKKNFAFWEKQHIMIPSLLLLSFDQTRFLLTIFQLFWEFNN